MAGGLLERCEGASPSSRFAPAAVPLSPREHEVALLAARGMTSRAIAERLFLSTRTVEGHLQRAYTKLGVTDRRELASVLAPR
jgi:DNA-binding CsgD family transcriptional regulator